MYLCSSYYSKELVCLTSDVVVLGRGWCDGDTGSGGDEEGEHPLGVTDFERLL